MTSASSGSNRKKKKKAKQKKKKKKKHLPTELSPLLISTPLVANENHLTARCLI
jgi:hypothetical protein